MNWLLDNPWALLLAAIALILVVISGLILAFAAGIVVMRRRAR